MQDVIQQDLALEIQDTNGKAKRSSTRRISRRANQLDGKTWTKNSISVWNDIRKSPEELKLGHPALFPTSLVTRLIESFTTDDDRVVFDPFVGVGSTAIAAEALGKVGIGIDLSQQFLEVASRRSNQLTAKPGGERRLILDDSFNMLSHVAEHSIDFVVTSPPYWDILMQPRTADLKAIRHYGDSERDLGRIPRYREFVSRLQDLFGLVLRALKPGKYCCIVVMDIRKKDSFYMLHADLSEALQQIGFVLDDLIIWDRRQEYNNLRPLGFPSVFRINRVHEYILIFKKPLR